MFKCQQAYKCNFKCILKTGIAELLLVLSRYQVFTVNVLNTHITVVYVILSG